MKQRDKIDETDLLFRMVGINTNKQTIDLILRTQNAFEELGAEGFTLMDACKLKAEVERKYDRKHRQSSNKYKPSMLTH